MNESKPKAFPVIRESENGSPIDQYGMDLRDFFAIHIVNGIMSNTKTFNYITNKEFAKEAYKLADAMLKERERK